MKCEACNTEISSKMRGALKSNTCPFCSGNLMSPVKAEQYSNLLEVLDQTSFTNRSDVDFQIREKVATLLVTNFIFKKLDLPKPSADIIVLDDSQTAPPSPIVSASPISSSVTTSNVTSPTPSERALEEAPMRVAKQPPKALKPQGTPKQVLSAAEYTGLQDETYNDSNEDSDVPSLSDIDGLTPEEIIKAFPELSIEDIQVMKTEAVGAIQRQSSPPRSSNQNKSSGSGIKRLNR